MYFFVQLFTQTSRLNMYFLLDTVATHTRRPLPHNWLQKNHIDKNTRNYRPPHSCKFRCCRKAHSRKRRPRLDTEFLRIHLWFHSHNRTRLVNQCKHRHSCKGLTRIRWYRYRRFFRWNLVHIYKKNRSLYRNKRQSSCKVFLLNKKTFVFRTLPL